MSHLTYSTFTFHFNLKKGNKCKKGGEKMKKIKRLIKHNTGLLILLIPAEFRRKLNLQAGDLVSVALRGEKLVINKIKPEVERTPQD